MKPAGGRPGSRSRRRALTLLAALVCSCGGERPARGPNVLLISIDTLRADHLSSYGYERGTSPRLDALAAEGVRFADCVSTTSWTLPSHLSLLTGLEISAHGVCDDRLWNRPEGAGLPLRGTFAAEVLSAAGWRTAGFYSSLFLEAHWGFAPGFELYERVGHTIHSSTELRERFLALQEAGDVEALERWRDERPEELEAEGPKAHLGVDRTIEWLEEWERAESGDPFFVFLHLFDVHDNYVPPPPFDELFDPDYDGPIDGRRITEPDSLVQPDMPRRDLEHLIALYDGEIAWVDSQLGRLFDWLDEAGLADDTLVVVTSDHGEEFFEHGNKVHRNNLAREVLHVPLLMRWPGELPAGLVVPDAVSLVDVSSTIYSLLDVAEPPGLSGIDLTPSFAGTALPDRDLVSELYLFPHSGPPRRAVGLHSAGEQLVFVHDGRGPAAVLRHDLAADPRGSGRGEVLGAAAAGPAAERLEAARRHLADCRALSAPRDVQAAALDATQRAELEDTGYAAGSEVPGAEDGERLCIDGCVWD